MFEGTDIPRLTDADIRGETSVDVGMIVAHFLAASGFRNEEDSQVRLERALESETRLSPVSRASLATAIITAAQQARVGMADIVTT